MRDLTLEDAIQLQPGDKVYWQPNDSLFVSHPLCMTEFRSLFIYSTNIALIEYASKTHPGGEDAVYDYLLGKNIPGFPLELTIKRIRVHDKPIPHVRLFLEEIPEAPALYHHNFFLI